MLTLVATRGTAEAWGTRYVMGTLLSIRVAGTEETSLTQARNAVFQQIQDLENQLSIYRPTSEVFLINQAAGRVPVAVSQETFEAVAQSIRFAHLTAGAFDPTVQKLSQRANYREVILDPPQRTIFLSQPGMRIDLGGIGKGFALDRAISAIREWPSVERVMMDFGGQLFFWSSQGSFAPEEVVIENPEIGNAPLAAFRVSENGSVSTSSNGERHGHLLDPRTGRPAEGTLSVTVVAPTGAEAEALSTALFVMNVHDRTALLKKFPRVKTYIFLSQHS